MNAAAIKHAEFVCRWCDEPATFNRLFDDYWCADCRCADVTELQDDEVTE